MGSFGCYVDCWHCWQSTWDPYIVDFIGHPLCDRCLERLERGLRPVWHPDNLARSAQYNYMLIFRQIAQDLTVHVMENIMSFIVRHQYIP